MAKKVLKDNSLRTELSGANIVTLLLINFLRLKEALITSSSKILAILFLLDNIRDESSFSTVTRHDKRSSKQLITKTTKDHGRI